MMNTEAPSDVLQLLRLQQECEWDKRIKEKKKNHSQ